MSARQIHIFISHSWSYSGHYDTLSDWILIKIGVLGKRL